MAVDIHPTSFAELGYMSTIRLLITKPTGPEVASAFVVSDNERSFLVTAAHCVEGATSTTLHFYSGNEGPSLGDPVIYEVCNPGVFWRQHGDAGIDVAVASLADVQAFFDSERQSFFVASIPLEFVAPKWEHFPPSPFDGFRKPLALDEVLIVGYPNDYRDNPTSLPLMRRGITATPLWLDHEGRPVFLVDAAVSHGTSGGPVFFVEEKNQSGNLMHLDSGKIVLLGVFSEVLPPKIRTARPGVTIRPPNIGAVYKAHVIRELLVDLCGDGAQSG